MADDSKSPLLSLNADSSTAGVVDSSLAPASNPASPNAVAAMAHAATAASEMDPRLTAAIAVATHPAAHRATASTAAEARSRPYVRAERPSTFGLGGGSIVTPPASGNPLTGLQGLPSATVTSVATTTSSTASLAPMREEPAGAGVASAAVWLPPLSGVVAQSDAKASLLASTGSINGGGGGNSDDLRSPWASESGIRMPPQHSTVLIDGRAPPTGQAPARAPALQRAHSTQSTNGDGSNAVDPDDTYAPPFHYAQVALLFFVVPLFQTLFWLSIPLDYNTVTDDDPTQRVVNFPMFLLFTTVYFVVAMYFGLSASNYLTRTWKNRHGAAVVICVAGVQLAIYGIMYGAGAPNSAFIRLSYILPPLVAFGVLLYPFVRIYQLHIDPVWQARHWRTATAIFLLGVVGAVLWSVLQVWARQFSEDRSGDPTAQRRGQSLGVVLLFAVVYQLCISLSGAIISYFCTGNVAWQAAGLFRYIYSMLYYMFYRLLFFQVQDYGDFFLLQFMHLLGDLMPVVQVSERYVTAQNALARSCAAACLPDAVVRAMTIHDVRKHRMRLAQNWTFGTIARLFSIVAFTTFGSFLRATGMGAYFPIVSQPDADQYHTWLAFMGLFLATETASVVVVVLACRALYGMHLLNVGKYMRIGTDFRWIIAFTACHFANDPLWSLISYNVRQP